MIRHLLFDLGGVLLNIDYGATAAAFRALGIPDFDARYSQLRQTPLFDDLETGRLSAPDFLAAMRRAAGGAPHLTDAAITAAWNAMLLDFPPRRIELLKALRQHYNLYLLSNTNEIHEAAFNDALSGTHGLPSLAGLFDKVYFSHRVGLRKPGREVFKHILSENALRAEETLFIDDSSQHIETAQSLGIQTVYLEKGKTVEEVFREDGSGLLVEV